MLCGKVFAQLDEVWVSAVLEEVENVLSWETTVWAGINVGVPSFSGVLLSPESS